MLTVVWYAYCSASSTALTLTQRKTASEFSSGGKFLAASIPPALTHVRKKKKKKREEEDEGWKRAAAVADIEGTGRKKYLTCWRR